MMRRFFIDVETLPPDKNSMESCDREEISPSSEDDYRRLALDGDYGRVLTIGLIVENDDKVIHRGVLGRERQTMMFHLD